MKLDREPLLAAVKAASSVMMADHTVSLFTKIWLLENQVLAFNNAGTVINMPIDLPMIGGVDGHMLGQMLNRSDVDEIELSMTDNGQCYIKAGRSHTKLAVLDPSEYVTRLVKAPEPKHVNVELDVAQLVEDVELDMMLKVKELKSEPRLDFSCVTFVVGNGRMTLYTSDRSTINRSIMKIEGEDAHYAVPLEFMRTVKRLWSIFGEGQCTFDKDRIMFTGDGEAKLYNTLTVITEPVPYSSVLGRIWADGKIDTKTLVDIPEEFGEVLKRASLIAKDNNDTINVVLVNEQMTVTSKSTTSDFKEVIDFCHPDVTVNLSVNLLLVALPYIDRIYMTENGVAMFGPKRFSRFIAPRGGR